MIKHGGLREAYEGYYEEDWSALDDYEAQFRGREDRPSYRSWLGGWCARRCAKDTPQQRLEIYCEWNGIIGYSSTLYEIATGGDAT